MGIMLPLKSLSRFSSTARPTFPLVREAPMTATDSGLNNSLSIIIDYPASPFVD